MTVTASEQHSGLQIQFWPPFEMSWVEIRNILHLSRLVQSWEWTDSTFQQAVSDYLHSSTPRIEQTLNLAIEN